MKHNISLIIAFSLSLYLNISLISCDSPHKNDGRCVLFHGDSPLFVAIVLYFKVVLNVFNNVVYDGNNAS